MVFDSVFDFLLGWSLKMHPFLGILLLSFIVTMISNIIYKYVTDQREMKHLKTQIEKYRKQIKESRDNPKKMMKLNNEAMDVNFRYMKKTFKPMLFTFIPIILVIGWMASNYTYAPLDPGEPMVVKAMVREGFSGELTLVSETLETTAVTSPIVAGDKGVQLASFALRGEPGRHDFTVLYENNSYGGNTGEVFFGEQPKTQSYPGKGPLESIIVEYPRVYPLGEVSVFGWRPGWLAVYIILSIALSLASRKLMKIY